MSANKTERMLIPLYVVGYPKSGNTWLSRLIADATDSNVIYSNEVDAADYSSDKSGEYAIYKAHDRDIKRFPDHARFVYVVRDVRDVLLSAFFFNHPFFQEERLLLEGCHKNILNYLCCVFFYHQVRRSNKRWCSNEVAEFLYMLRNIENTVGNWSEHVTYWRDQNVCVVRYEDLLEDAEGELKRIFSALGANVNDDALKKAVSNQSFAKRKKEFLEAKDDVNAKFLRRGTMGDWKRFFPQGLVEEIEREHDQVMKSLGYKPE